ncbi:hypothetical protein ABIA15_003971 [Sinorhizobium fredii]
MSPQPDSRPRQLSLHQSADNFTVPRNCYREIRNGYGTLQMLDLTDSVKKGRAEVMNLVGDIEALLADEETGVANG